MRVLLFFVLFCTSTLKATEPVRSIFPCALAIVDEAKNLKYPDLKVSLMPLVQRGFLPTIIYQAFRVAGIRPGTQLFDLMFTAEGRYLNEKEDVIESITLALLFELSQLPSEPVALEKISKKHKIALQELVRLRTLSSFAASSPLPWAAAVRALLIEDEGVLRAAVKRQFGWFGFWRRGYLISTPLPEFHFSENGDIREEDYQSVWSHYPDLLLFHLRLREKDLKVPFLKNLMNWSVPDRQQEGIKLIRAYTQQLLEGALRDEILAQNHERKITERNERREVAAKLRSDQSERRREQRQWLMHERKILMEKRHDLLRLLAIKRLAQSKIAALVRPKVNAPPSFIEFDRLRDLEGKLRRLERSQKLQQNDVAHKEKKQRPALGDLEKKLLKEKIEQFIKNVYGAEEAPSNEKFVKFMIGTEEGFYQSNDFFYLMKAALELAIELDAGEELDESVVAWVEDGLMEAILQYGYTIDSKERDELYKKAYELVTTLCSDIDYSDDLHQRIYLALYRGDWISLGGRTQAEDLPLDAFEESFLKEALLFAAAVYPETDDDDDIMNILNGRVTYLSEGSFLSLTKTVLESEIANDSFKASHRKEIAQCVLKAANERGKGLSEKAVIALRAAIRAAAEMVDDADEQQAILQLLDEHDDYLEMERRFKQAATSKPEQVAAKAKPTFEERRQKLVDRIDRTKAKVADKSEVQALWQEERGEVAHLTREQKRLSKLMEAGDPLGAMQFVQAGTVLNQLYARSGSERGIHLFIRKFAIPLLKQVNRESDNPWNNFISEVIAPTLNHMTLRPSEMVSLTIQLLKLPRVKVGGSPIAEDEQAVILKETMDIFFDLAASYSKEEMEQVRRALQGTKPNISRGSEGWHAFIAKRDELSVSPRWARLNESSTDVEQQIREVEIEIARLELELQQQLRR